MVAKLHSKFAEVQYVELLLKKLKPQVCFMCLSEIVSCFWQIYFKFWHACGNWNLCIMRNYSAIFLSSKTVFYQNCLQILSKKTFSFLEKSSAGLAKLHANSFDEFSDVSFWRESTLIKVSSFEEKEQKTIWFYSKSPPFFLRTAFCFSRVSNAFFWNKIQTHN